MIQGWSIRVRGIVQGVGFRPTVYKFAQELGVKGQVFNDGEGVVIDAWGPEEVLSEFVQRIQNEPPPLASIEQIETKNLPPTPPPAEFSISKSSDGLNRTGVAPDAATCDACLNDVFSPFSRRYRYPFTNCTHCGPRLSIVKAIPYDRANTSMNSFKMCKQCQEEYENPEDRRFHAQPNACHACGPRAWLERADGRAICIDSLSQLDDVDACATLIKKGEIVAIKGIGGFHLACDATNEEAVARLRSRKKRFDKPFALMAREISIIKQFCRLEGIEEELLKARQSPIVVLRQGGSTKVAAPVAPNQVTLGFMLPYTPLHHLLMKRIDRPIVLTSGNISEEPQCIDNSEAKEKLGEIADYFLLHNREIVNRLDDSVVMVANGSSSFLRRGRGYAPMAVALPDGFSQSPEILAMGGELKNTFCMIKDNRAILSQHIGDIEDARTYSDYQKNLNLYQDLFQHHAQTIAVDLHPDYLPSKLGRERAAQTGLSLAEIQHHHAHIASCLADNKWPLDAGPVLGVALDGLGYGGDGTFWGGEFLRADYKNSERLACFKPVAMLGGAQAIREPWRNTYAHLMAEMGWNRYKMDFEELELTRFFEEKALATFNTMLASGVHSPKSTSCGRLFDAVAAAIGICRERVSYEGQAAIELEAAIDINTLNEETDALAYPFAIPVLKENGLPYIEPIAMWQAVLGDLILNTDRGVMAARFHKGLIKAILHMIRRLTSGDDAQSLKTIALSGGVFQNRVLLELLTSALRQEGFTVLTHNSVPANDGGLSLGQATISAAKL